MTTTVATLPRRDMTDCPPAALRPLFDEGGARRVSTSAVIRRRWQ